MLQPYPVLRNSRIIDEKNDRKKEFEQKEGKYKGRKSVINPNLIRKVKDLKENSNLSVSEISRVTGVSRPTIYKVLKKHLGYVSNRLVKANEMEPLKGERNAEK